MDELHGRFHRLDRIATPNLWNEAVGRAAELEIELAPRRVFTPAMGLMAVALLLAAFAGTVAVGAWLDDRLSPSVETITYDNGMMVAHLGCDGLVAVDPLSFEQRQLVAIPGGCESADVGRPAWSRDGSRLAYAMPRTSDNADAAGLWVYEPATGETRLVEQCRTESCDTYGIDISPDGSLVAYVGSLGTREGGRDTLTVIVVASGETHRVPLIGSAGLPVFSPDGDQVAVPLVGGTSGVHLVDVGRAEDGVVGSPTLMHGIVEAADLAWSPNGRWIAMTQTGGLGSLGDPDRPAWVQQIPLSGKGIVIVRADGTETRVLATLPNDVYPRPAWAPDSESVAYLTGPGEGRPDQRSLELWTVTIDGGEPERIFESACCTGYFGGPIWSPDGEQIAFGVELTVNPSESGTFLVRPDGSGVRKLSRTALDLVWQPIPKD